MIWHIVKRELYDNFNSLRFALATVLLLALMLTNALVHLREHPSRVQRYHTNVEDYQNTLTSRMSLYDIAQKGPGLLHKKPSPLRFCAEGGEAFLADVVDGSQHGWSIENHLKGFWRLIYPPASPNLHEVRPDVTKVDWAFVMGTVLSLLALLFTFDSISGERERGTLRLILAQPIPRHSVLIGKFLGAVLSLNISVTVAVLMNLLVISTSSDVHFSTESWGRLGIIFFIVLLYTCLFLALGLLVSTYVQQSPVSLGILLLTWVILVIFIPSLLGTMASKLSSPMTSDELWERQERISDELWDEYLAGIRGTDGDSLEEIRIGSEYVIKDRQQNERLSEEHLTQQISQVQQARSITLISPVAIFHYLLEYVAGTGFDRHLQFLENVQSYAREYRQFVVDTDRADPKSLHLIGVREGMSQQPVSPDAIPKFEDTLSLRKDFNTVAIGLLLLMLFLVVLLAGAFLAFVRLEV